MVTHLGGTKVLGVLVTMDGRQGTDLIEMIRPGSVVPVHYDDYTVFRSPLRDVVARCSAAATHRCSAPSPAAPPSTCFPRTTPGSRAA
ncbi:MAG: putative Zn-dependent hydrolase of beta-lactamase fold [Pseudonocardia sp.]|nr:putative Zn-dependent hydrolase of beta-lactamase fold [Pseudonocardia sp.]